MKPKAMLKWGALAILFILFGWFEFAYLTSANDCGCSIPAGAKRMKAIRYCAYGPPDVITLAETEKPVPNDNEVLVRVRAASLNALEAVIIRDLWITRLISGLRKPKVTRFGRDFAGIVEAVGKSVTE